jgi:cold-inducible RNA-binding protein
LRAVLSRRPCYGLAAYLVPVQPEKVVVVEVKLFVGNLPVSVTAKQVDRLFTQAGDVIAVNIITDRHTGGSRGYAYVTMSAQSEGYKAVSLFNSRFLDDHQLKVSLLKPREQRGFVLTY